MLAKFININIHSILESFRCLNVIWKVGWVLGLRDVAAFSHDSVSGSVARSVLLGALQCSSSAVSQGIGLCLPNTVCSADPLSRRGQLPKCAGSFLGTHCCIWKFSLRQPYEFFSAPKPGQLKRKKKKARRRSLGCMWSIKLQYWSQSCKRRAKSRVVLYLVWVNIPHLGSSMCTTLTKLIEHFNLQQAVLDVSCSLCTVSLGPSYKNTYPNFTSVLNLVEEKSLVSKISLIHRD